MALDTTVGGAAADSYASVADYNTYWASRPQSEVPAGLSTEEIEAALKHAARLLDSSFRWTGAAVDSTQALTWPRSGMVSRNGFSIATNVIPVQLKNAQCQFAGDLASADRAADSETEKQGISEVKAGPVAVKFANVAKQSREEHDAAVIRQGSDFDYLWRAIPDVVRNLLVPSWYTTATVSRPVLFGVDR